MKSRILVPSMLLLALLTACAKNNGPTATSGAKDMTVEQMAANQPVQNPNLGIGNLQRQTDIANHSPCVTGDHAGCWDENPQKACALYYICTAPAGSTVPDHDEWKDQQEAMSPGSTGTFSCQYSPAECDCLHDSPNSTLAQCDAQIAAKQVPNDPWSQCMSQSSGLSNPQDHCDCVAYGDNCPSN